MRIIIKGGRIEFIPEKDVDRARLAQIPEGSNEVFIYTTLDGGDEGNQEALVIHIGPIPPLEEVLKGIHDAAENELIEEYRKVLPLLQEVYGPHYNPLKIVNGEPQGAHPGDLEGISAVVRLRQKMGLPVIRDG